MMMSKMISLLLTAVLGTALVAGGVGQKMERQEVDVILFAGQSNISGLGDASKAPEVPEGVGYEFRAVTDPTRLYHLEEPFGENENREGMCDDSPFLERTGSLASAFVNAYYAQTGTPVVAVAASRGSSKMSTWLREDGLFIDAGQRLDACLQYLNENPDYKIRHIYMVWLQGESDISSHRDDEDYAAQLQELFDNFHILGVEKCFLIRVGMDTDRNPEDMEYILEAQTELCRTGEDFVLVSVQAVTLPERGMLQDAVHYTQEGYNLVGEEAGTNAGIYVSTGVEPSMYDPYYESEYVPAEEQAAGAEAGAGTEEEAAGAEAGTGMEEQAAGAEAGTGTEEQAAGAEAGAETEEQDSGEVGEE